MPERTYIRSRIWPRFLRWALTFQIGLALFVGVGLAIEGVRGDRGLDVQVVVTLATLSAFLALLALGTAFRRRNMDAAEITPRGIRTLHPRMFHHWDRIGAVRVKVGPFGNRWLQVTSDYSTPFTLPARPSDPDGVLDALDRFAGPDHPLTRAYFLLLDR